MGEVLKFRAPPPRLGPPLPTPADGGVLNLLLASALLGLAARNISAGARILAAAAEAMKPCD